MAPHSSTLAWKIPWMEEPGGLQSMGLLRVRHDWTTSLSLFTFMHWRRKWQPTPVFLPGESQGRGAWWAAVCGVIQSRTRLKRLSRSNSGFTVCQRKWEFLDQWFIWNCSDFVSLFRKLGCGAFALSWILSIMITSYPLNLDCLQGYLREVSAASDQASSQSFLYLWFWNWHS